MRRNAWRRLPRLNGLWRQGAGTVDDPNNGRLIWRLLGPTSWSTVRGPAARTVAGYLRLAWNELTRYETEVCQRCGRKVRQVWWCPSNELWEQVVGCGRGGVLCIRCFDELYQKHQQRGFLRWFCTEERRGDL